jgi:Myotubularin-like phosphatase domain
MLKDSRKAITDVEAEILEVKKHAKAMAESLHRIGAIVSILHASRMSGTGSQEEHSHEDSPAEPHEKWASAAVLSSFLQSLADVSETTSDELSRSFLPQLRGGFSSRVEQARDVKHRLYESILVRKNLMERLERLQHGGHSHLSPPQATHGGVTGDLALASQQASLQLQLAQADARCAALAGELKMTCENADQKLMIAIDKTVDGLTKRAGPQVKNANQALFSSPGNAGSLSSPTAGRRMSGHFDNATMMTPGSTSGSTFDLLLGSRHAPAGVLGTSPGSDVGSVTSGGSNRPRSVRLSEVFSAASSFRLPANPSATTALTTVAEEEGSTATGLKTPSSRSLGGLNAGEEGAPPGSVSAVLMEMSRTLMPQEARALPVPSCLLFKPGEVVTAKVFGARLESVAFQSGSSSGDATAASGDSSSGAAGHGTAISVVIITTNYRLRAIPESLYCYLLAHDRAHSHASSNALTSSARSKEDAVAPIDTTGHDYHELTCELSYLLPPSSSHSLALATTPTAVNYRSPAFVSLPLMAIAKMKVVPTSSHEAAAAAAAAMETKTVGSSASSSAPSAASSGAIGITEGRAGPSSVSSSSTNGINLGLSLGLTLGASDGRGGNLVIKTSDYRIVRLSFARADTTATDLALRVAEHTWLPRPVFPFLFRRLANSGVPANADLPPWGPFSFKGELLRLLAQTSNPTAATATPHYRLCALNSSYQLCPSYPCYFLVPASVSDADVAQCAKFRSSGRLPAISWFHGKVCLARCSQPKAGLWSKRNGADERLIGAMRSGHAAHGTSTAVTAKEGGGLASAFKRAMSGRNLAPTNSNTATPTKAGEATVSAVEEQPSAAPSSSCIELLIADARPRMNALGNAAKGSGGSENMAGYRGPDEKNPKAELVFLGIDNIHAVRDAFKALRALVVAQLQQIQLTAAAQGKAALQNGAVSFALPLTVGKPTLDPRFYTTAEPAHPLPAYSAASSTTAATAVEATPIKPAKPTEPPAEAETDGTALQASVGDAKDSSFDDDEGGSSDDDNNEEEAEDGQRNESSSDEEGEGEEGEDNEATGLSQRRLAPAAAPALPFPASSAVVGSSARRLSAMNHAHTGPTHTTAAAVRASISNATGPSAAATSGAAASAAAGGSSIVQLTAYRRASATARLSAPAVGLITLPSAPSSDGSSAGSAGPRASIVGGGSSARRASGSLAVAPTTHNPLRPSLVAASSHTAPANAYYYHHQQGAAGGSHAPLSTSPRSYGQQEKKGLFSGLIGRFASGGKKAHIFTSSSSFVPATHHQTAHAPAAGHGAHEQGACTAAAAATTVVHGGAAGGSVNGSTNLMLAVDDRYFSPSKTQGSPTSASGASGSLAVAVESATAGGAGGGHATSFFLSPTAGSTSGIPAGTTMIASPLAGRSLNGKPLGNHPSPGRLLENGSNGLVSSPLFWSSEWIRLLSILLSGGLKVAQTLASGVSVLVHCSDGWDRTAQLTSLGQLLLDPYARTLEGFASLIEKEWLSFGHRFARRTGTGGSSTAKHKMQKRKTESLLMLGQAASQALAATTTAASGAVAVSGTDATLLASPVAKRKRKVELGTPAAPASPKLTGGHSSVAVSPPADESVEEDEDADDNGGEGDDGEEEKYHQRGDHKDGQRAPIFLQFLDSVWQLLRQFPDEFEFNERLLVLLAEHSYSALFGTFLFDTERERWTNGVYTRTESLWSEALSLHSPLRAQLINHSYYRNYYPHSSGHGGHNNAVTVAKGANGIPGLLMAVLPLSQRRVGGTFFPRRGSRSCIPRRSCLWLLTLTASLCGRTGPCDGLLKREQWDKRRTLVIRT